MSPYEILLRQEDFRRVGLCARVKPGMEATLLEAIQALPATAPAPFGNLHAFLGKPSDYPCVFVYLETTPEEVGNAAVQLARAPAFAALSPYLTVHPRATVKAAPWIQMELINVIGPTSRSASLEQTQHLGYTTLLRPELELNYRTLHQTNWPGVVDQMARSHYRYWITFLIEIGTDLPLFTYCQYVGPDKSADDEAMASDPTTCRWWKHTQPCLKSPAVGASPWQQMTNLQGKASKVA